MQNWQQPVGGGEGKGKPVWMDWMVEWSSGSGSGGGSQNHWATWMQHWKPAEPGTHTQRQAEGPARHVPDQPESQQCSSYMGTVGCGWTADFSCPGQDRGTKGRAHDDGSEGYKCCCTDGLWSFAEFVQCGAYMEEAGCGWTSNHSCPGQRRGAQGRAQDDGSEAYQCCCKHKLWQAHQPRLFRRTLKPLRGHR
mmetsp:Transcript_112259/g.362504  ORF Transcript_112259/g.362504 Transcript_112259/m.362504 type:complete len:194 (+) Transcript_112259:1076-1657(+)